MKILLKRDARILHKAGEAVEASPAEARHLIAIGSAVPAPAKPGDGRKPKKEEQG